MECPVCEKESKPVQKEYNPSKRNSEKVRRERVMKALKTLEEVEYISREEWDRLKVVFTKILQRNLMKWYEERRRR